METYIVSIKKGAKVLEIEEKIKELGVMLEHAMPRIKMIIIGVSDNSVLEEIQKIKGVENIEKDRENLF